MKGVNEDTRLLGWVETSLGAAVAGVDNLFRFIISHKLNKGPGDIGQVTGTMFRLVRTSDTIL